MPYTILTPNPIDFASLKFMSDKHLFQYLFQIFVLNDPSLPRPKLEPDHHKQLFTYFQDFKLILDFHFRNPLSFEHFANSCKQGLNISNITYADLTADKFVSNNKMSRILRLLEYIIRCHHLEIANQLLTLTYNNNV